MIRLMKNYLTLVILSPNYLLKIYEKLRALFTSRRQSIYVCIKVGFCLNNETFF